MVIFLQYLSVIHERSLRTDGIPTLFSGGDTVHGNEGVSRSPRSFSSSYFLLHMRPVCRRGAQITVGTRYLYSKRRRFCDNIYPVILIYISDSNAFAPNSSPRVPRCTAHYYCATRFGGVFARLSACGGICIACQARLGRFPRQQQRGLSLRVLECSAEEAV